MESGIYFPIEERHLGVKFFVTVFGMQSTRIATTIFTDGNVSLTTTGLPSCGSSSSDKTTITGNITYIASNGTAYTNLPFTFTNGGVESLGFAATNGTNVSVTFDSPLLGCDGNNYVVVGFGLSSGALTVSGNTASFNSPNGARTLTANYKKQQIVSLSISNKTYGDAPFAINASST